MHLLCIKVRIFIRTKFFNGPIKSGLSFIRQIRISCINLDQVQIDNIIWANFNHSSGLKGMFPCYPSQTAKTHIYMTNLFRNLHQEFLSCQWSVMAGRRPVFPSARQRQHCSRWLCQILSICQTRLGDNLAPDPIWHRTNLAPRV